MHVIIYHLNCTYSSYVNNLSNMVTEPKFCFVSFTVSFLLNSGGDKLGHSALSLVGHWLPVNPYRCFCINSHLGLDLEGQMIYG